jgi:fructokinase
MKQLIDSVWEYAENNPDGFTLNIETMKPLILHAA